MNLDCDVVRDLLPLYADGACSPASAALVEAHLAGCPACRRLHREMTARLEPQPAPALRPFRGARRLLLGIILAAAVLLASFLVNFGGAWMGDRASPGHLAVTGLYTVFWFVFAALARPFRPLLRVAFVLCLLTAVSGLLGLVGRLAGGGYLLAFCAVFASVPLYGLRLFLDWTWLYTTAAAAGLAGAWWTGRGLRRLGRETAA